MTEPNLPAIGCPSSPGAASGRRARDAPYASRRCRASTPRPATTAPRASCTGAACPRTTWLTEAYGTTDEAVAALGLARALCETRRWRADLLTLQRELFVVGADLATNPRERGKLEPDVSLVTERHGARGSSGGSTTSWRSGRSRGVHRARARTRRARRSTSRAAIVRRAERRWWRWSGPQREVNPEVRRYLNRLSDLLFVLARWQAGESEPASRADA